MGLAVIFGIAQKKIEKRINQGIKILLGASHLTVREGNTEYVVSVPQNMV